MPYIYQSKQLPIQYIVFVKRTVPLTNCGEGPTKITEGQFSDGVKKQFTPSDFRFTTAGGFIYAIALRQSANGRYCIKTFAQQDASKLANFHGIIDDIKILGCEEKPDWIRDEEGLHIDTVFKSDYPITFRIKLK